MTFARKPAPVQVSFLGYAVTTGMSAIGYRITDAYADPPGTTEHLWTEKLVRLPKTAWCYRPPVDAPAPNRNPQKSITFGCFGRRAKHSPATLAMWAQILQRVPNARLVLKAVNLDANYLQAPGIDTSRVQLRPRSLSIAEHLAAYNRIDVALDTFPYHGTTTTCEALWMGVPIITRAGASHISRVGASLLSNAGLTDLIGDSDETYIELAVALADDAERLKALRHNLRERMRASPLMDEAAFAAALEASYRTMWADACDRADQPRRRREGRRDS
jgi:protein O-GlcNAc transferase